MKLKVKWPRLRPNCIQNVNPRPISLSQGVILSKMAVCTSQPVAFSGHPSTRGCLTGLRDNPQEKQISQLLVYSCVAVIS